MKPFFSFYGGKWRAAPRYPAPEHSTIIEPFAGSAGYSVRHHEQNVILYEIDPMIAGVWDYLIHAKESEIRALPARVPHIKGFALPQEARWLIGFLLNSGTTHPCNTPSSWSYCYEGTPPFWGPGMRERIASQVCHIRHWKIVNASYEQAPDAEATWFIDPPYCSGPGKHYKHRIEDYSDLAEWCIARRGQVIVCEAEHARWLPFQPFGRIKATNGRNRKGFSNEVIWTNSRAHARTQSRKKD